MEISLSPIPMAPNANMLAKQSSPSKAEHNGKVEMNGLSRKCPIEFSWIDNIGLPVFAIDLSRVDAGLNQHRRSPIGPQFTGMTRAFLADNYSNKLTSFRRATKDIQLDQR